MNVNTELKEIKIENGNMYVTMSPDKIIAKMKKNERIITGVIVSEKVTVGYFKIKSVCVPRKDLKITFCF